MSLSEFELIQQYFERSFKETNGIKQGIGDDAAIVSIPSGMELALSVDTLVQDVHFFANTRPEDVGYKALAVNLSDLAAMGAEPRWATLSLTLPEADQAWLEKFTQGFFELAGQTSVTLIGGDLSRGPLSITVQAHGLLPEGKAIMRNNAQLNDLIYVSGQLGDAGLALKVLNKSVTIPKENHNNVFNCLNRPNPRIELGMTLRDIATSAIDISDGLVTDLGHILDASQCGAILNPEVLPLSKAFDGLSTEEAWEIALTSGDDYELCFTISADKKFVLDNEFRLDIPLTRIGTIVPEAGMQWIKSDGTNFNLTGSGYQHF
jgi:thiamine-monophosphate kinase